MRRPAPAEVLRAVPAAAEPLLRAVIAEADARGVSLLLVGGPVRDLLLGRPLRDVDLLVEDGEARTLAEAMAPPDARVTAHDRFGTVSIEHADVVIDLATVRSETYAHPGALPSVAPGTLEDDLRRRDFSVNALALPLSRPARARRAGIVGVDGAIEDLASRTLRILHPHSFHDDPTRALRAVRLGPRLGFRLSRDSHTALRSALRDGAFGRVSGDRLRRELVKLFEDAALGLCPARALRLLADWHVLAALEPGLDLPRAAISPLRRLGRTLAEPPWRAPRWRPWAAGLGLWLAPLPAPMRRRALARFALRGTLAERIASMGPSLERARRRLESARGRGATDAALSELGEEELHALYARAPSAARRRIIRYAAEDRHRKLPLNGADLTALGLSGPAVGRALARIRASVLDGAVHSREEALALAREVARRRGSA